MEQTRTPTANNRRRFNWGQDDQKIIIYILSWTFGSVTDVNPKSRVLQTFLEMPFCDILGNLETLSLQDSRNGMFFSVIAGTAFQDYREL